MKMQRGAVVRIVSPKRLWLRPVGVQDGQDVGHTASAVIVKLIKSAKPSKERTGASSNLIAPGAELSPSGPGGLESLGLPPKPIVDLFADVVRRKAVAHS